jgi:hypothetical protein
LQVTDLGQPITLAFACGAYVPWVEADSDHVLTLVVAAADGRPVSSYEQRFQVGRSRLAGPDDPAHQPFTIRWQVLFPSHGRYILTATVDSRTDDVRRATFHVQPAASPEPVISEEEMNIIDEELGLLG